MWVKKYGFRRTVEELYTKKNRWDESGIEFKSWKVENHLDKLR